jgi:hypothetical protein
MVRSRIRNAVKAASVSPEVSVVEAVVAGFGREFAGKAAVGSSSQRNRHEF